MAGIDGFTATTTVVRGDGEAGNSNVNDAQQPHQRSRSRVLRLRSSEDLDGTVERMRLGERNGGGAYAKSAEADGDRAALLAHDEINNAATIAPQTRGRGFAGLFRRRQQPVTTTAADDFAADINGAMKDDAEEQRMPLTRAAPRAYAPAAGGGVDRIPSIGTEQDPTAEDVVEQLHLYAPSGGTGAGDVTGGDAAGTGLQLVGGLGPTAAAAAGAIVTAETLVHHHREAADEGELPLEAYEAAPVAQVCGYADVDGLIDVRAPNATAAAAAAAAAGTGLGRGGEGRPRVPSLPAAVVLPDGGVAMLVPAEGEEGHGDGAALGLAPTGLNIREGDGGGGAEGGGTVLRRADGRVVTAAEIEEARQVAAATLAEIAATGQMVGEPGPRTWKERVRRWWFRNKKDVITVLLVTGMIVIVAGERRILLNLACLLAASKQSIRNAST